MSAYHAKQMLIFVIAGILACFLPRLQSQIVYSYDSSGNPTNSILDATQPLSSSVSNSLRNVLLGQSLSLCVEAAGSGIITYQWQLDGMDIAGATNATFFTPQTSAANAGSYSVIVSNGSTTQTNQLGNIAVAGAAGTLYAAAFGLGEFVAVGSTGTIIGSSNLLAWSAFDSGTTNQLNGVVFETNVFVAVGAAGTILTSTNGTSWVSQDFSKTNSLNGIAYGNGLFLAVGDLGEVLTSMDGTNWAQQSFGNPKLLGVVFGGGHFVAVGTGGSVWTSLDGTNWQSQITPEIGTLNAVAYGNGLYVAAGDDGAILSSVDSTNWTPQVSGTPDNFTSVLFYDQTFYAIGPAGQNYISSDAEEWEESDAGTFIPLWGSKVCNGIPVATGENGLVLQIPTYKLDHFGWSVISSPQRVNQPFAATITASDAAGNTVSNFNGLVSLSSSTSMTSSKNMILGSVAPGYSASGSETAGYAFTPNANLLVTDVRHYDVAQKVCIWAENGDLLASVDVTNNPGNWVDTPMPEPLTLAAGSNYVVSVYTGDNTNTLFYYRDDGPGVFANGTIDQALAGNGDAFPGEPSYAFWYLVDLGYAVQVGETNLINPSSATFENGLATVQLTASDAGQDITLTANDNSGHSGVSGPFDVLGTNDIAVTMFSSPNPVAVESNLTYTITVMNAGPNAATGVVVTNILPASASFVSASSSLGSCQYSAGEVTCNIGNLPNQNTATITITATPALAGITLTDLVNIAESGADSDPSDNAATNLTFVPPTLTIGNILVFEPSYGIEGFPMTINLSSPSVLDVEFDFSTMDGTNAIAGRDYDALSGKVNIPAGVTTTNLFVWIQGSAAASPPKEFFVKLSSPVNATFASAVGAVIILNPNGQPGQLDGFSWGSVPSPQSTNAAFRVTLSAQDAFGNAVTNYTGPVALTGVNLNDATNTLLASPLPENSASTAIMTTGYAFTPTNDIFVMGVRSYSGSKVSIWTETGFLLASQNVSSQPGAWTDTPLARPVWLQAGNTYLIGSFTDGGAYYWREDGAMKFSNGEISQGYSCLGDAFPTNFDSAQWYLVDLRYANAASISPSVSGVFVNGVWTGNMTAGELGTNFMLLANDREGHIGFSNPFGVYATNDLALTLSTSPAIPLAFSNLAYSVTILNPGPDSSTGVLMTNILPSGANFVSAATSQGACSEAGGIVTANLGTMAAFSSATVTITVEPMVAGLPLTNSANVTRNEPDPDLEDNSAVSVVIPNESLTTQIASSLGYGATPWLSGGDALWGTEGNVTHGGTNAAQSGAIVEGQQTWIQTRVYGPGTLSFWWSVSSEAGSDSLSLLTNGVVATDISGSIGWQQVTLALPPGHTTVEWNYSKSGAISAGLDAGWLDQVVFSRTPTTLNSILMNTNGDFDFSLNGMVGQILVLQTSTNLFNWVSLNTNTMTSGTLHFTNSTPTNSPIEFYRALDVTP